MGSFTKKFIDSDQEVSNKFLNKLKVLSFLERPIFEK